MTAVIRNDDDIFLRIIAETEAADGFRRKAAHLCPVVSLSGIGDTLRNVCMIIAVRFRLCGGGHGCGGGGGFCGGRIGRNGEELCGAGDLLREAVEMLDKADEVKEVAAFAAGEAVPAGTVFVYGESAV